ncbi:MAG: 6-phosphogluconate dehydrogenase, partial [Candidatus Levybacteria bacterium]|nr:6-phosphogluconate dehydrogenase [Candidatus Levybacteria bacterium]
KSKYKFDLLKISRLWQKGTIISGFLLDRAKDALEKDGNLAESVGPISASGEAEWTVNEAKEQGSNAEIIERSLEYRKKSQTDLKIQNSFSARVVNALRREFGGHPVRQAQGKEIKK